MKLKNQLVLASLALLSACAPKLLKPDGVSTASLSGDTAILVGTFARNPKERAYYSQTFYFKNLKTGEVREIKSQQTFNPLSGGKTADDFKTSTSTGGLFVYSLPAGDYTFHNFRLYQSSGSFNQNWYSAEDYSIPFQVKSGRINYVGEIRLEQISGKNFFGMRVNAGGVWHISNERVRDLDLLRRAYPELPLDKIDEVIPSRKDKFTPLVILPAEIQAAPK